MKPVIFDGQQLVEADGALPAPSTLHDLDPARIVHSLQTTWWGKRCLVGDSITSTIDIAKALLPSRPQPGTLILANHQTGGRGRQGNAWSAPPGRDLLLTFIVRGAIDPNPALLSMYSTSAIAHMFRAQWNLNVLVKWPNDLYLDGRKLAGSLVECVDDHVLVSLGLNVNSLEEERPPEVQARAVSLRDATKEEWCRTTLLTCMGRAWEDSWNTWMEQGNAVLVDRWRNVSMLDGKQVRLNYKGNPTVVHITGVSDSGNLQVVDSDGRPHEWPAALVQDVQVVS